MKNPIFLFEDHCESYIHWKDAQLKNLCVIHVDAHLDVAVDGLDSETIEAVKNCRSGDELEEFRKNDDILWGGFHPGNYLYPAMLDGTVSKLIWVIPPHLTKGQDLLLWTKEETANWVDMSLSDYDSLKYSEGRVTGSLLGCVFEVCLLEDLKVNEDNYVWDIDIDYMIDEKDLIWITPQKLFKGLNNAAPLPSMVTMAYSVKGGYLPPQHKFLGNMLNEIIENGKCSYSSDSFKLLLQGDEELVNDNLHTAYDIFQSIEDKEFLPFVYLRMSEIESKKGRGEEAKHMLQLTAELDESLIPPSYDKAMIYFRRKEYRKALELLDYSAGIDPVHFIMSHFISAVIYLKIKDYSSSAAQWEKLLNSSDFSAWDKGIQAHLFYVSGLTYYKLKSYDKALALLSSSIEMNPQHQKSYLIRGKSYLEEGLFEKAAKDFRKYLWINSNSLESLEAHLMLAETYRRLEKRGMEKAEVRNILRKDVTGFYSIKARLGRYV